LAKNYLEITSHDLLIQHCGNQVLHDGQENETFGKSEGICHLQSATSLMPQLQHRFYIRLSGRTACGP